MEDKIGTQNQGQQTKPETNFLDINPTISIITLNVNGLNRPINTGIIKVDQEIRPNYMLSIRNPL